MSTYLVAMVVADFRSQYATTARGTEVRVWSTPALVNQTQMAASMGAKLLDYFEEYFDIPFPLSKQG